MGLDSQKLESDLRAAAADHRGFIWIKRKISAEESRRLRDLKCEWIEFQPESVREYPDGGLAAHLLGGVFQGNEKAWPASKRASTTFCKGKPGTEDEVIDVKNRILDSQTEKPAQPGESITLTIDARIQFIAEREIKAAVEKHKCRSGTVIAMNPNNGADLRAGQLSDLQSRRAAKARRGPPWRA